MVDLAYIRLKLFHQQNFDNRHKNNKRSSKMFSFTGESVWEIFFQELRALNLANSRNKSSFPELFCKKTFIKLSQKLQEKTFVGVSFLIKLQV